MKSKNIIEALNGIDPAFITEAAPGARAVKKKKLALALTLAAALALIAGVLAGAYALRSPGETPGAEFPFSLTGQTHGEGPVGTSETTSPSGKASAGEESLSPAFTAQSGQTLMLQAPTEDGGAFAAWLAEYGSDSAEYGDRELYDANLLYLTFIDADGVKYDPVPWENWGNPKHFQFLINFDTYQFDLSFDPSKEESPYTWHIWYTEKDAGEEYKECVTKPWSVYDWGDGTYLFRVPTYAGGMTDIHSRDGAANEYRFVICIYKDGSEELFCWHVCTVTVNGSYERLLQEALDNGYVL